MSQWNKSDGRKATYLVVLNELCVLQKIDIMDEIRKMLEIQSEPGPPPITALQKYQEQLKYSYVHYKLPQIIEDDPLPPSEKYFNLAMISEEKPRRGGIDEDFVQTMQQGNVTTALSKSVPIKLEHIFDINPLQGKLILLEGAPGSGKTRVCWHICQQWGEGLLFTQFQHVLMVELRDPAVHNAENLEAILPYSEGLRDNAAKEMIDRSGEDVLIILEGWNESPKTLQQQPFLKSMIQKSTHAFLHKAVILISSQSNVTADLQRMANRRIQVLGFTPPQIENYVRESLLSVDDDPEPLLEQIKQNPKLQGSCYLPLSLVIVTHIFICDHALPETFCCIIMELALSLLQRYLHKVDVTAQDLTLCTFDDIPNNLPPNDIKNQFLTLCKLAFECTMEEKYYFSSNTPGLGLLQSVQSLVRRGKTLTQYFLHSSLQQLCAAIHISKQPHPEQEQIVQMLFERKNDYVLRFYSALTKWKDEQTRTVLVEHATQIMNTRKNPTSGEAILVKCSLLFTNLSSYTCSIISHIGENVKKSDDIETAAAKFLQDIIPVFQDAIMGADMPNQLETSVFQSVTTIVQNFSSSFLNDNFLPIAEDVINAFEGCDNISFFQLLLQRLFEKTFQNIHCQEDLTTQTEIPIQPEEQIALGIQLRANTMLKRCIQDGSLLKKLFTQKYNDNIKEFRDNNNKITHSQLQEMSYIEHGIEAQNQLMIVHCIHEAQDPHLAELLQYELEFSGKLSGSDITALGSVIEDKKGSTCRLRALMLFSAIFETEVHLLIEALQKNKTIKVVALTIGEYSDELVEAILKKPHIKVLGHGWSTENEQDRAVSCELFFSRLAKTHHLQALTIYTQLRNQDAILLAQALNNTRLIELRLCECNIEEDGIIAISEALASNSVLRTLHLINQITPNALHSLSIALKVNMSLICLSIREDFFAQQNFADKDLEMFVNQLRLNSSLVFLQVYSIHVHTPSFKRAVQSVNYVRDANQHQLLSIYGHSRNECSDGITELLSMNNITELLSMNDIHTFMYGLIILKAENLKSINNASNKITSSLAGNYIMEYIPVQSWHQTLVSSLLSIDESKAIRNMCMSQIVRPNSRTVSINISAGIMKSQYSVELHPFRALLLYMQYVDGSLCITQQKALKPTTGSYCIESIDSYQNTILIEECMGNIVRHMMLPLCTCMDRGELCSRCTFTIMKYTSRVPICREDCYECTMQSLGLLLSVISNRFNVCQAVRDHVYTCVYREQSHLCVSIPPLYIVNDVITKDFCKHSSMFSVLFLFLFSTSSFLHMFIPSQL